MERVNDLLRDELSAIIRDELKDPRVAMLSITHVETAPDLHFARVHISTMGDAAERDETVRALRRAAGFLRHELRRRVVLRHLPTLDFQADDSIERGARVLGLIRQIEPAEEVEG